jgi:phage repressor protein C with HTH and peptisase S24 domain
MLPFRSRATEHLAMTTPTPKNTQATRLAYLRSQAGLTTREVAEKIGRTAPRITEYESDPNVKIKRPVLEKLALLFKVTPDFILYGQAGPPEHIRQMAQGVASDAGAPESSDEPYYIDLPFVPFTAYGSFVNGCRERRFMDLSTFRVLVRPGIDYKDAVVIEVKGNSMAPRYPDQSCHAVRPVSDGNWQYATGVHCISLRNEMFLIKRIKSNREGLLELSSDNNDEVMSIQLGDILCMWKVGECVYVPAED